MAWMPGRSGQQQPRLLVLVVAGDAQARSGLMALARPFGVDVREAQDGEAAYRLALARPPDLILCDLEKPAPDGFGFIPRLRRDPRFAQILAVAVSETARRFDVAVAREGGFDGHIAKPVTPEGLARLLDRALDRQSARDESESQRA